MSKLSEMGDEELLENYNTEYVRSPEGTSDFLRFHDELLRRLSLLRAAEKVMNEVQLHRWKRSLNHTRYCSLCQSLDEFNTLKRKEATDGKDTIK